MGTPLLEKALALLESPEVQKVVETAKFYYVNDQTAINLYPAVIATGLFLLLIVPLLGSIPSIDLFPSFSSPYGQTSGYGAPAPSSGYGAPASGYGAPEPAYGAPAGGRWGRPGDNFRSGDAGDDLRQLYNSNSWQPAPENGYTNAARSFQVETPVNSLLTNSLKLLQ